MKFLCFLIFQTLKKFSKGAFNNYVDKKRGVETRESIESPQWDHAAKGRFNIS